MAYYRPLPAKGLPLSGSRPITKRGRQPIVRFVRLERQSGHSLPNGQVTVLDLNWSWTTPQRNSTRMRACRYATSSPLANSSAQTQKPLMPSSIGAVGSTIPPQNASAFSLSDQRSATLVPMLREPPVVPRGVAILRVMVAKPRRGTTSSLLISFHASSCISAGNSGGSRSAPRNSDTLIRIRSFYDTRCCNRPAAIETED